MVKNCTTTKYLKHLEKNYESTGEVPVERETMKSGRDGTRRDATRRDDDDDGRTDIKVEIFM